MKSIVFIVNPISGVGRQNVVEGLIQTSLDLSQFEPKILHTEAAGHATELAQDAANDGASIVVAVGGDGSVNEVGRGLIGTETAMGILPAGSGNGLARHLGIPTSLKAAINTLNTGKVSRIDTASMNGEPFVGVAGIGFDAHIGWEFSKYGQRGFLSYIKLALREYPKYRSERYKMTIDGKTIERTAFLVSFANSSQYGNNAFISPRADIRDGMLDICVLSPFKTFDTPDVVWRLFNAKLHESQHLEVLQGREITIETASTILHLDGEPLQLQGPLHVKVHPLSLQVVV